MILHSKKYFVQFLALKWDELSDNVCPSIVENEGPVDEAFKIIQREFDGENDQFYKINWSDYALMVLTNNTIPMNRFKGELSTPIWRTLESILELPLNEFTIKIVNLFLPQCKNRFWNPAVNSIKQLLLVKNEDYKIENDLLSKMISQLKNLPCFELIFGSILSCPNVDENFLSEIEKIVAEPKRLQKMGNRDVEEVRSEQGGYKSIMMFEPKVEKVVDPIYAKLHPTTKSEQTKLLKNKLKKERRGAEKELRNNTAFEHRYKNKIQEEKDKERKRKTEIILNQLADQEGDVRKIKKKKYKLFD